MNGFSITNDTNHANLKYFLVHSFAWTVIITLGQISGHQIEQTMEAPIHEEKLECSKHSSIDSLWSLSIESQHNSADYWVI